ncbi:MAG: pyruvate kinase [Acidobacteria bacterium]|nr:pyruvate kinase [Acidobacteriota bacterium]
MPRRTKIVATIGPASDTPAILADLIGAGMNMARIGLAHGTVEDHLARLGRIRAAAKATGATVGVLADLPGPKVRAAAFPESGTVLTEDELVALAPAARGDTSDGRRIAVEHDNLLVDLRVGDKIALGDGGVELEVESLDGDRAVARVLYGGRLLGSPGVNLPPERFTAEVPTAEDMVLIDAMCDAGVDAIAVSFVRRAEDVAAAKRAAGTGGPMVVAKIETQSAVDDLERIIAESDGVMVARGDLGVRCALEDVPHYQKRIIRVGVAYARPVITATQMLESMVLSPRPTRAEVSDVANAVFDGSSALMLSGETAIGRNPVAAVATMARIAARAEQDFDHNGWGARLGRQQLSESQGADAAIRITTSLSAAAWRAAIEVDAAAIIACTNSGATARAVSRFRPVAPIIAATPSEGTARRLSVAWGIQAIVVARQGSTDDIVWFAVEAAAQQGRVKSGDVVAVLVGSPIEPAPTTDVLRLVRVR